MLAIAILAAGKGTRMRSNLPKVLHQLAGKSLIERVLANCKAMNANHQFLIVGHKSEDIKKTLSGNTKLEFVLDNYRLVKLKLWTIECGNKPHIFGKRKLRWPDDKFKVTWVVSNSKRKYMS